MAWAAELSGRPWTRLRRGTRGAFKTDDTEPLSGFNAAHPYSRGRGQFLGSTSSPYNYLNSYIGTRAYPTRQTGLSSTVLSTINDTNSLARQNNQAKYVNRTITAESTSDYGRGSTAAKSSVVPLTFDRSKVEAASPP